MSTHRGAHRCTDPRCGGFDRARVFARIKKQGSVAIHVFDVTTPFIYTIGLFANHQLPELFMMVPGMTTGDAGDVALTLLTIADYLSTLPTVDEGTTIPNTITSLPTWLWAEDERNRARFNMGIARDYYRDVHMQRLENVPVFFVSPKPHPNPRTEHNDAFAPPLAGGLVAQMLARADAESQRRSSP